MWIVKEKLDQQLEYRQAREVGICPIREELYAQVGTIPSRSVSRLLTLSVWDEFGWTLGIQTSKNFILFLMTLKVILQCMDELIRQITINCAERGLLLLRVRDELRMASIFPTPYSSTLCFTVQSAIPKTAQWWYLCNLTYFSLNYGC